MKRQVITIQEDMVIYAPHHGEVWMTVWEIAELLNVTGTAVKNTIKAPKATDKEKRHAGKVFHEMDGNQFYEKFMENSEECKKNIHDYVTFYLQTHKIVEISKPKKEFKVPDSIEDFNILDFV